MNNKLVNCNSINDNPLNYAKEIETILSKNGFSIASTQYTEIELRSLYDLYINNIIPAHVTNHRMIGPIATYYATRKDFENMKKYYLLAIETGDSIAMVNLGLYYEKQKDFENMKKYYLMAIEKDNSEAMNCLGLYYYKQKDYENMKKYWLMAIEKGNTVSMCNFGSHYKGQKDFENMEKYYLMAINLGEIHAMYTLGRYYEELKKYNNMEKYYLMAIEHGHEMSFYYLKNYYETKKHYRSLLELIRTYGNNFKRAMDDNECNQSKLFKDYYCNPYTKFRIVHKYIPVNDILSIIDDYLF